ncbi:hypothetical protein JL720_15916 [Aureococcus anophagefferens]|nr:hypothetical protein JL720_15916 [Aureococcus anophagefferens]
MMALARAARRRLLPRGALRPTSRSAVTTTFLPENREWHEPAVLSAAAASFRDDELRLLDALAEAAAASLDRAVEASAAEACLDASVAAAGDGDAAALLADFAARGDLAALVGAGATAAPSPPARRCASPTRRASRSASPSRSSRRAATATARCRRAGAASARAADAGAAALLEPAAAAPAPPRRRGSAPRRAASPPGPSPTASTTRPSRRRSEPGVVRAPRRADGRAYVRPAALAEATDEFFPEHAKLGKELATALLRHREQFWREHEEGKTSAYLTGAFCLFCAAADYAIMVA